MRIIWTVDGNKTSWAVDLGCGTGRAFLPLSSNGFKIIGIEPIPTATRISLERAKNENITAVPVQATASQLPIQSHRIKLVLALGILFHLTPAELGNALQEIFRVLDKEGTAVLHFLDIDDWRRNLAKSVNPENLPLLSYHAVITCFCSPEIIMHLIGNQ